MGQKGERHASAAVCVKERRKGRGTKEEKAEEQLGGRRTLDGVGLDRDIKRVPIFENDWRLAKGELAGYCRSAVVRWISSKAKDNSFQPAHLPLLNLSLKIP